MGLFCGVNWPEHEADSVAKLLSEDLVSTVCIQSRTACLNGVRMYSCDDVGHSSINMLSYCCLMGIVWNWMYVGGHPALCLYKTWNFMLPFLWL